MKSHPILVCLALAAAAPLPTFGAIDGAAIQRITGLKGSLSAAEGVFKVSAPRTDVPVAVDGWTMPPFMGLTSWAAFSAGGKKEATVMGDLVLFQDEVNPVMSALLEHGVEVTALHNHFFYADPMVYFMHIGGEGTQDALARGVRAAFAAVAAVRRDHAEPARTFGLPPLPPQSRITAEPLAKLLGAKAQQSTGMVKFVIGRYATMSCGCKVGADMGVNTWAAFAGSDDNAVVDGDFVVRESELQPVLKALRHGAINLVAIHHHMIGETPRMIFLHYWGRGPASALASTLKAALSATSE